MASTLKVNTIQTAGGNVPTVADLGINTVYWKGQLATAQTMTRYGTAKVTGFTSGELDSHNAFDGTTFTVPANRGGIYFCSIQLFFDFSQAGSDGENVYIYLYKNGAQVALHESNCRVPANDHADILSAHFLLNTIQSFAAGDTVECYARMADNSSSGTLRIGGENTKTDASTFMGYQIA